MIETGLVLAFGFLPGTPTFGNREERSIMNRASRRRWLAIASVLGVLAALPQVSQAGSPSTLTHSWNGYHWARQSNPFNLKLGDNVSSAWDGILATTSTDWTKSTVLNTSIVAGQANPRNCRPTSGRVEVCNATYGNTGWLGVAQIWLTTGNHISQGTVKLNDTYFNTSQYNTTAWRNLVSCQEVGHTLGLDHQDTNFNNANLGTCMDYTNNPGTNQHPNQHDYDELVIIYTHTDSFTSVGLRPSDAPSAMFDIDFSGPDQWGKVIEGSREEHTTVHELDFGGGNKVLTFVIWADEEESADRAEAADRSR
jgi:hypothetical protein